MLASRFLVHLLELGGSEIQWQVFEFSFEFQTYVVSVWLLKLQHALVQSMPVFAHASCLYVPAYFAYVLDNFRYTYICATTKNQKLAVRTQVQFVSGLEIDRFRHIYSYIYMLLCDRLKHDRFSSYHNNGFPSLVNIRNTAVLMPVTIFFSMLVNIRIQFRFHDACRIQ